MKIIKVNHSKLSKKTNRISFAIVSFMTVVLSSNAHAIDEFKADYAFKINNKYSGTATRTLTKKKNQWHYNISARASLGVAKANQSSIFVYKDNFLKPKNHELNYKILFKKTQTAVDFNYAKKKVNVVHKGNKSQYALLDKSQDILTMELQVREDMNNDGLRPVYYLADKKRIKKVTFKNLGRQQLSVPAGTFDVVKISQVHKDPKRKTYFYLAPKLNYLPIKVYQDNKGKIFDFKLKKIHKIKMKPITK